MIEIKELTKNFGGTKALDTDSFSISDSYGFWLVV